MRYDISVGEFFIFGYLKLKFSYKNFVYLVRFGEINIIRFVVF